jgi:putative glycosyltransferase (TIGR04372 family)
VSTRRLIFVIIKKLALIIGFLPAFVLRLLNVRVLPVFISRIGHLAIDVDCYLKEDRLGLHPRYDAVLCAPADEVANRRLAEYWSSYVRVISSPWACLLLKPLAKQRILQFDLSRYAEAIDTVAYVRIQKLWAGRPPLLSLTPDDVVQGKQRLLELGIPADAWFVCVHSREGGYSPQDEHFHTYRNSDINAYVLAMEAIVAHGGWCVRIGDPSMKRLSPMRNVVDYAHHPSRADWMDLFLCARCRFFLGNTSGVFFMAGIFGVPVALANLLPVSTTLPFGAKDLGIPKLLWSNKERRLLTFSEILASPLGNMRYSEQYRQAAIDMIDNTPEDILDLALEQLERTEGRAQYTDLDEDLQARFKTLMRPGHYTYGSESRIGRAFLRKYSALL